MYLLDIDICIFFLQGRYSIYEKILSVGINKCHISEISIAELKYGALKSSDNAKHNLEVNKISQLFTVVPIFNAFDIYAKEKVTLKNKGELIPDFDLLIAASAIQNDYILVSNNEKHLSRIQGIKLQNWTKKQFNKYLI